MERVASAALLALVSMALAAPAPAGTLDQIKQAGRIRLGYRADARPFSFKDDTGNAAGYSAALCLRVTDAIKADLGLASLGVEWVPVSAEDRFRAVQQGQVDLLCGADTVTLSRRAEVAFSIPTFPGGIGALLRVDAPARLREVLSGRRLPQGPAWRGSAGQLLQAQTFSVIGGTTAEKWLGQKLNDFQLTAQVVPVDSYDTGIRQLLDRKTNVFFGDRAILLDAAARNPSAADLLVLDRLFSVEPLALGLARADEDLRLAVDKALSRLYASGEIGALYAKWFGEPTESTLSFFRSTALPE